jgi:hypothetical protein
MENTLHWTKAGLIKNKRLIKKLVERDRARFCKAFITAIDARDSKTIYEMARAIERLTACNVAGDRYRSEILNLKRFLEISGGSLTVRQVAAFIKWPHKDKSDGFSQLRKLLLELKFPLTVQGK